MTMQTLVNALPALQKLGKQDLPLKTLYKVSRVLKKLDENLKFYYSQKQDITAKYWTIRDGRAFPKEGCAEECNAKINELLELEVEVDAKLPVKIEPSENITLSYNDLISLENIIEFEYEDGNTNA